jgi:hypothetical protein
VEGGLIDGDSSADLPPPTKGGGCELSPGNRLFGFSGFLGIVPV